MSLRLYLIRHGETEYNRQKIMQGHAEIPLNDAGIEQAARLGRRMRDLRVDRIISSDLRRTVMTAAILGAYTGAPIEYSAAFRERNPGALTHRPYAETSHFFTDPDFLPPEGEGQRAFDLRVANAFETLALEKGSTGDHLAIVTHGMVCASFLHGPLGYPNAHDRAIRWRNTALTIVDYDGSWRVTLLADASHLEAPDDAAASATGA